MKKNLLTLLLALVAIATTARAQNTINGHEYVDLGLPSGTLWATCNVGATKPEEPGTHFAWGETQPKNDYSWDTYKWCNGSAYRLTKYCNVSGLGDNGFADNKTELDLEDDAANANWGGDWRMPSLDQIKEIVDQCNWEWETLNGAYGRRITGPNGNSIFLPAAGWRSSTSLYDEGTGGGYWSRMISTLIPYGAYDMSLESNDVDWDDYCGGRRDGQVVRPVVVKSTPSQGTPYAVWCEGNSTLYFLSSNTELKVGGTYNGQTISGLWSGETVTNSPQNEGTGYSPVAWMNAQIKFTKVVIEESFKDVLVNSTSAWFMSIESIEGLEYLNTSNVTSMSFMFGSSKLTNLDLSHFDTRNVKYMQCMFLRCPNLTSLDLSHFDTKNVLDMHSMFRECTSLSNLDVSKFKTEKVTNMSDMFYGCSNLASLDISGFNTKNVTDMSGMFYGCSNLTSLDVSGFNTEKVTNMSLMFANCSNLTSLDVSGFNTENVTNMWGMFGCPNLTSLDVSGFNTEKVTNMSGMFSGCSNLTSLDVSGFNTEKVTNMSGMFSGCSNLASLDISSFNTENVTDMSFMFAHCSNLTSLDVSGFNTENVTDMYRMFAECSNLTTIYASNTWTIAHKSYSDEVFYECKKLVGGAGTVYNSRRIGSIMAQIDGGSANPGYFTEKKTPVTEGLLLNAANFPDANFRAALAEILKISEGDEITDGMIAATTELSVFGRSIADLTGIEHFTALKTLYCGDNQLTSLDVSNNTALTTLLCESNQLTSLDVSKNTALKVLFCRWNRLPSLDVSKNTALTELHSRSNQLTSLDVSKNTALTELDCYNNQLTSLDVSKNTALTRLYCSSNQLTSLDVSKNTALTGLECGSNQLTSLDVSKNTALGFLHCGGNQLTSLDVSKNTALTRLVCESNQLTSLDVSKNTALTYLSCDHNQLTSLDVSQNTALTTLYCDHNRLTSLDVSKNTALTKLSCYNNPLTSLDVSKNTALTELYCYSNQIKGREMDALVNNLPTVKSGYFYVIDTKDENEGNVCTKSQVAVAKGKGWTVYDYNGWYSNKQEYEGSDPVEEDIDPVDEDDNIDYGSDMDENSDLDGNVIGDIYYNINTGNGGYDAAEGCIVVTKPTDDGTVDELEGKDIFGEDFKSQFTGIVFKVPAGKGTIKVDAETTGNMLLKVKIGSNDPVEMELNGKLKVTFPYNVSEATYVYIYAGAANEAKGFGKASATDAALKIYGIEFLRDDVTGIDRPTPDPSLNGGESWYTIDGKKLNGEPTMKGVYVVNGRKVVK